MNTLLVILIFSATCHLISSAPLDHIHQYELSMLNKLHKPWFTKDRPQEYPRKGEYPCKGGVCKTKVVLNDCEDCQHAQPLDFEDFKF